MWAFPVFVMLPCRSLPPLERSLGTTPMNAISSLASSRVRKRSRSASCAGVGTKTVARSPRR